MKRKSVPSYLLHRQSGRARALWTDPSGIRRERLLPGTHNSQESRNAFARLLLELTTSSGTAIVTNRDETTLNEVLLAFVVWAEMHYRTPDGAETSEVREYKLVCRHLRELYGTAPAASFGPLAMRAVRQRFIEQGWCRGVINQRVGRIVRMIKWAVAEELVPPSVHHALAAVAGLRVGRSEAPESKPIKPVDPKVVAATLPYLNRHLQAMVELQSVTGMRPGEVGRLRLAEIDRSSNPWVYRPSQHKTRHHGKARLVMIGPRGQAVIKSFIAGEPDVNPADPLFSPLRAREERYAMMRAKRKTSVQPSQVNRRNLMPKLIPAEMYTTHAYADAIGNAAKRAKTVHWHPNQIRHSFACEVRRAHGLEAAQVLLGHSRADVTQVYAERNEKLAAAVAAQIG